jgi:2-dehydro-3-deoxyphosphogluconate aldolase / (4S)-4-hydroxy-2-oxoglutarate aldolase
MQKSAIISKISETGLVPMIRTSSADVALQILEAVREGGVPILEIMMTTPNAMHVIEELARRSLGDVLVGAGTVLDAETARACILAGANFITSPSLDEGTVACCRRYAVAVLPGAFTPTEVVRAWQAGADMVRVFPCGAAGGASYIRALKGSLPYVDLVPTGGVSIAIAGELIRAGASAIGISDLVDGEAARQGDANAITENARRYLEGVRQARAVASRAPAS